MLLAGVVSCGPDEGADAEAKGGGGRPPSQVIEPAGRAPRAQDAGAVKFEFERTCAKVKSALGRFLDKGLDRIGCWDVGRATKPETEAGTAEQITTRAGVACRANPGRWWYTRFDACGRTTLTYTVIDLRTKRPTGRAAFTATQQIKLSHETGRVSTSNTLQLTSARGTAKGLTAAWGTSCSGGACRADSAWPGPRPMRPGRVQSGTTDHAWTAGVPVQSFRMKSTITIRGTAQVLIAPAWFGTPMKIRCDKTFNLKASPDGKSRGCVFPAAAPVLELPLTHEGHANVAWSMNNLKGHWGWQGRGKPLVRQANKSTQRTNRRMICRDGTWKKDRRVTSDSCDEFPFAATRQSGGESGLKGKDCAEIRPENKNGKWVIHYVRNVTPSSRCTIGHVPSTYNVSVGGTLSRFYQDRRVIDGEKYWISVG
ncbi:hypothetical protein RCO28_23550 [Streptomyces sp. LHD-70]|uniref:NucA/NucB deoxyribonuclease domain-containing protein n=1 Tax=Streptomyces sp. LHD-70 TaxID=3072140 RepID=UPI00281020F7|nr:hypothetical protein [Streptomyces sp. LHD-70]MDQ8705448.1 hypothetical protein [Streptomyces sp. LHD-70]